jgi:hypothetical protein
MSVLVAVALALVGCGGGSNSPTSDPPSGIPGGQVSGEPSAGFVVPNGNNEVAEFGHEAGSAVRQAASKVLAQNLKARQAANFALQCSSLTIAAMREITARVTTEMAQHYCPSDLKEKALPLSASKGTREDTLTGSIAALRREGKRAFALYHGSDGNNYAMLMEREAGAWKVGSIVTIELGPAHSRPNA